MKKAIFIIASICIALSLVMPLSTSISALEPNNFSLANVLEQAAQTGFCYHYTEESQNFDGTRIVQGTEQDMQRLKASSKGTFIIRYKTSATSNQVLFAAGKDYKFNTYGAILANTAGGLAQQRIDFPDGMVANLADTNVSANTWHTFVYSVDATDLTSKIAKTVTSFDGSVTTQYPNFASWFNANPEINSLSYLSIGGAEASFEKSGNNTNFNGQIAFVAFVPETFTQEQAAALSSALWPEEPDTGLVYSAQNITIANANDALSIEQSVIEKCKLMTDATVLVKYRNTNSGIGSLFSVSDSTKTNAHFHFYQNGSTLGFEYRNNDNPKYAATAAVYDKELNTVAFKAENGVGYKLFANGVQGAFLPKTGTAYQFLNAISNLNSAYIGKTSRSNDANSYSFTGVIEKIEIYNQALTDEVLLAKTSETKRESNQVFYNGDSTTSTFFRIPFLLSTSNDTLIAGVDANFGSTGDSADNIDAAIRVKKNATENTPMSGWEQAFIPEALHMKDYADEYGYKQKSASVIDGLILQDTHAQKNRVLLLIDAFAWNGGVFQHLNINSEGGAQGGTPRSLAYGDGFCTINGRKYLLLSSQNIKGNANGQTGNINNNTDRSKFDFVADIYGEKNSQGKFNVYHLMGTPRPYSNTATTVDDTNLSLGALSEYSITENYELCKNNTLLTVVQKSSDINHPVTNVPMRIFYEDSALQMYNTSYIIQIYSDDNGATWHSDKIISGMFKRENSRYYILGPGSGIQIKNGPYAGRLIAPVYYQGRSSTEVIFSDDGGNTWQHGEPIPSSYALHESSVVEMPNGSLKIFVRNTAGTGGKSIMATSTDGGRTWKEPASTFGDIDAGLNCQISAIGYSTPILSSVDGKSYPAVILSMPYNKSRTYGKIYVGLIKPNGNYADGIEKYKIDWEYEYDVTNPNTLFAYSCLTELANGKIAMLYETSENSMWTTGLKAMFYNEFTIDQLIA